MNMLTGVELYFATRYLHLVVFTLLMNESEQVCIRQGNMLMYLVAKILFLLLFFLSFGKISFFNVVIIF